MEGGGGRCRYLTIRRDGASASLDDDRLSALQTSGITGTTGHQGQRGRWREVEGGGARREVELPTRADGGAGARGVLVEVEDEEDVRGVLGSRVDLESRESRLIGEGRSLELTKGKEKEVRRKKREKRRKGGGGGEDTANRQTT